MARDRSGWTSGVTSSSIKRSEEQTHTHTHSHGHFGISSVPHGSAQITSRRQRREEPEIAGGSDGGEDERQAGTCD